LHKVNGLGPSMSILKNLTRVAVPPTTSIPFLAVYDQYGIIRAETVQYVEGNYYAYSEAQNSFCDQIVQWSEGTEFYTYRSDFNDAI